MQCQHEHDTAEALDMTAVLLQQSAVAVAVIPHPQYGSLCTPIVLIGLVSATTADQPDADKWKEEVPQWQMVHVRLLAYSCIR